MGPLVLQRLLIDQSSWDRVALSTTEPPTQGIHGESCTPRPRQSPPADSEHVRLQHHEPFLSNDMSPKMIFRSLSGFAAGRNLVSACLAPPPHPKARAIAMDITSRLLYLAGHFRRLARESISACHNGMLILT